jgi:hypothetical protein
MDLCTRRIDQSLRITARIQTASMITSPAKLPAVKTSGIAGAAVSIAVRENRRRRTKCDRDRNTNADGHCPSPLVGIGAKETG